MSYPVKNPEDRFSHDEAHLMHMSLIECNFWLNTMFGWKKKFKQVQHFVDFFPNAQFVQNHFETI